MAIQSFNDRMAEAILKERRCPKGFPADLFRSALKRLLFLEAADTLDDLKSPPSNRLHPLHRDREGQHAISINDQFRICFVWTPAGPERVEITDYH